MKDATAGTGLSRVLALIVSVACPNHVFGEQALRGAARDSAGVTIVEHTTIPASVARWTVAARPSVSIGSVDGARPDGFGSVNRLVVRDDGVIIVMDWQSASLRAFGPTGDHLWTTGRSGNGPGEFSAGLGGGITVELAMISPDSILTYDLGNRRVQVFDRDGRHARSFTLDVPTNPAGVSPSFVGATAGRVVMRWSLAQSVPQMNQGYSRPTVFFTVHDRGGRVERVVGSFLGTLSFRESTPNGGMRSRVAWLSPEAVYAAGGGAFVAGSQDRFQISRFDLARGSEAVLRVLRAPEPVTSEMRSRMVDWYSSLGQTPEQRASRRSFAEEARFAETLPEFGDVTVDADGRLWVEEYVADFEAKRAVWRVFGPDGALLGEAEFPDGFVPHHVSADRVTGVWRDALDVAYVQVRPITR